MAHLLGVMGRYCSIIKWAGMALAVGRSVEWLSSHESSVYTLTQVATYLATNGVTYHDADDAWNPEVAPICDLVEANIQCMSGEAVSHSCEHILELAVSQGVEPHLIPPLMSNGECEENSDWQDQMVEACELYALPAVPPAASLSTSMAVDSLKAGAASLEDGEVANLFEGPAPM
ncbi:hypothetical protein SCLCIDRAFT_33484 [Scleroderma citrinum Foug A]|uniref:Uncharacterized protein n=1 Tax=Scleroderma citrinum Foug A TaxID=1036808 RepID=A0A0C2YNS6_9AGAM|nr:hypothetical protein SCLCIDRAFT_33484 [Scleroderma citrinum Foug A]